MSEPIALVTGASRGLGAAMAEALAASHHVVAAARTVGGLEELDDRLRAAGGAATLAPCDITRTDQVAQLCRGIWDRWRRVDLWVHCAIHAAPLSPAAHMDGKDWAKSVAVNVTATATLIGMVDPLLQAADAPAALFPDDPRAGQKFFGAYGATKAAQAALVRSWAAENGRSKLTVLLVEPRPMATATRARFFPGEERSRLAQPRDEAARLLALAGLMAQPATGRAGGIE